MTTAIFNILYGLLPETLSLIITNVVTSRLPLENETSLRLVTALYVANKTRYVYMCFCDATFMCFVPRSSTCCYFLEFVDFSLKHL